MTARNNFQETTSHTHREDGRRPLSTALSLPLCRLELAAQNLAERLGEGRALLPLQELGRLGGLAISCGTRGQAR